MNISDPFHTNVKRSQSPVLQLECEGVSGNSHFNDISWYHNEHKIGISDDAQFHLSSNLSLLTIKGHSADVVGLYKCLMNNDIPGGQCLQPYYIGKYLFIYVCLSLLGPQSIHHAIIRCVKWLRHSYRMF